MPTKRKASFAKQSAGEILARFPGFFGRDLAAVRSWYVNSRAISALDVTLFHLLLAACLAFFPFWLPFINSKLLHLSIGFAIILILIRLVQRFDDRLRLRATLSGFPFMVMGLFIFYTELQAIKYRLDARMLADPQIYMKPLTLLMLFLLFSYIVSSRRQSYSTLIAPMLRMGGGVMVLIFLLICSWNYAIYFFFSATGSYLFSFSHLNTAMETGAILLPLLLLVSAAGERKYVFALIALFFVTSFLVVGSAGGSSVIMAHPKEMLQLGLPLSMLVYWLAFRWQTLMRDALFVSIGVVIAFAPWLYMLIGHFIHQGGNGGLMYNISDRVAIWSASAVTALQTPWFGRGLESLKIYKYQYVESIHYGGYSVYIHPHNFFLQLWNDLGAVGAAFLLVPLFYGWRFVVRLKSQSQPAILASLMMGFVGLAVTHSMWSTWWLGFFIGLFALIHLLGEEGRDFTCEDEDETGLGERAGVSLFGEATISQKNGSDSK